MTNPVLVVRQVHRKAPGVDVITDDSPTVPNGRSLWMWCPGCDAAHRVAVVGEDGSMPHDEPTWEWDGDLEQPTISPSILVHATGNIPNCHSFLRAGRWEFLGDCTHALAGQTVAMVPLPDWLAREDS